jgi:DNA-binding response OmpR family regulator
VPLVVIASSSAALAESVASELRREGSVVYVTHTAEGCLRVATAIAPDVVLLDATFPERVERLLKAHPMLADARVLHLSEEAGRPTFKLPRVSAA